MRIALIHKRFSTHGGTERYVYNLSRELIQRGNQVDIYCMNIAPSLKIEMKGITFHQLRPLINWNIYKEIFFALKTRKIVTLGYDIVMGFGKTIKHDVYRAGGGIHKNFLLNRKAGNQAQAIRLLSFYSPKHIIKQSIEALTYDLDNFGMIVVNSKHVRDEITDFYDIPEDRIEVIYNGVDVDKFNPKHKNTSIKIMERFRIPTDIPVILFVGTGFARKGLSLLIKAVSLLEKKYRRELSLVIVGKDNRSYSYRRQSQQENLKHVYFLGPQINVEKFYGIGDIFVLPTYYDPFANAALEAMASGLPVITTSQNGASELITNGDNGYVLMENSAEAIAQAIMKLLSNENYKAAGERARVVAQQMTIEKNTDQILSVFSRVKKLADGVKGSHG
ncbi:MAG: glycosyltransferase family 4 protein [Deltaproteobacteria bacterium]|nr:glycosyltransferase family 4 protein [Deltaproteobacteria bacterium]